MDLKGIKLTWLGHATFRIETRVLSSGIIQRIAGEMQKEEGRMGANGPRSTVLSPQSTVGKQNVPSLRETQSAVVAPLCRRSL